MQFNGMMSGLLNETCGVPQGSICCTKLFLLYIFLYLYIYFALKNSTGLRMYKKTRKKFNDVLANKFYYNTSKIFGDHVAFLSGTTTT